MSDSKGLVERLSDLGLLTEAAQVVQLKSALARVVEALAIAQRHLDPELVPDEDWAVINAALSGAAPKATGESGKDT